MQQQIKQHKSTVGLLWEAMKKDDGLMPYRNELRWIEISSSTIVHNIEQLRKVIGEHTIFAACVKGNAYGHGVEKIVPLFLNGGVQWLCVDSFEEADALRQFGVTTPIIIIGCISFQDIKRAIELDIRILTDDFEIIQASNDHALALNKHALIHIKIDTGMGRRGILPSELNDVVKKTQMLDAVIFEGIATHFASSEDMESREFFYRQLTNFNESIQRIKDAGMKAPPMTYCSNSGAMLVNSDAHFDLVKPGIAVYGYYPSPAIQSDCIEKGISLLPSLSFKTRIMTIKSIPAGSVVGYGSTFTAKRDTTIAILPVGYYDGFDRRLSNNGSVLVSGKRAPIIGNISMNMTVIDITDIAGVEKNDEVVLIGTQGNEKIRVEEIARSIGSINYEVMTRLRENIPRYYTE